MKLFPCVGSFRNTSNQVLFGGISGSIYVWNEVKHALLYTANIHSNPTQYVIPMAMEISAPPVDLRNSSLLRDSSYQERGMIRRKSSEDNSQVCASIKEKGESRDKDKSQNELNLANSSTMNNVSDLNIASVSAMDSKELTSFMSTDGQNIVFFSRTN